MVPTGASIAQADPSAILVSIDIAASNPNDEAIELREFRYTAEVDGARYVGRRAVFMTLQAGAEQRLALPVVLRREPDAGAGAPELHQWRISGTLLYTTPGEFSRILFEAGLRRPTARFSGGDPARLDAR
ncbi:MAG: hypothetical protein KF817_08960 [Phycisphaeraceae bacterium]|nr:hypothetical protein [Phycisphaeraceae bacterium]